MWNKKLFNFSQIKRELFFARLLVREVDFRNWRTDFVVWGLVIFTLAGRSAVKIFRNLLFPIVNSLQNGKAEKHQETPNIFFFLLPQKRIYLNKKKRYDKKWYEIVIT